MNMFPRNAPWRSSSSIFTAIPLYASIADAMLEETARRINRRGDLQRVEVHLRRLPVGEEASPRIADAHRLRFGADPTRAQRTCRRDRSRPWPGRLLWSA